MTEMNCNSVIFIISVRNNKNYRITVHFCHITILQFISVILQYYSSFLSEIIIITELQFIYVRNNNHYRIIISVILQNYRSFISVILQNYSSFMSEIIIITELLFLSYYKITVHLCQK